jgi:hypothetical protein
MEDFLKYVITRGENPAWYRVTTSWESRGLAPYKVDFIKMRDTMANHSM